MNPAVHVTGGRVLIIGGAENLQALGELILQKAKLGRNMSATLSDGVNMPIEVLSTDDVAKDLEAKVPGASAGCATPNPGGDCIADRKTGEACLAEWIGTCRAASKIPTMPSDCFGGIETMKSRVSAKILGWLCSASKDEMAETERDLDLQTGVLESALGGADVVTYAIFQRMNGLLGSSINDIAGKANPDVLAKWAAEHDIKFPDQNGIVAGRLHPKTVARLRSAIELDNAHPWRLPVGFGEGMDLSSNGAFFDRTFDKLICSTDIPTKAHWTGIVEDVEHAMMANNGGGVEWKKELCRCDASVGQHCEYCTVDNALRRCRAAAKSMSDAMSGDKVVSGAAKTRRVTIRNGAVVGQDFGRFEWRGGDIEFDAVQLCTGGTKWHLTADGYGMTTQPGRYGNGKVYADERDLVDVKEG